MTRLATGFHQRSKQIESSPGLLSCRECFYAGLRQSSAGPEVRVGLWIRAAGEQPVVAALRRFCNKIARLLNPTPEVLATPCQASRRYRDRTARGE